VADTFVRFRLGRTHEGDVWAVLLHDQPVDLATGGWVTRVVAAGTPPREWSSDATADDPGRVVLGTAAVELAGESVNTSTVQIVHRPEYTEEWPPFVADFDVVIERNLGQPNSERYTVLSGFMRGDDVATDDSPAVPA
jgi:hypothetical protein